MGSPMPDDDISFDLLKFFKRSKKETVEQLKQDDKQVHQEIKQEQQKVAELKKEDVKVERDIKAEQAKPEGSLDLTKTFGTVKRLFTPQSGGESGIDLKSVGAFLWKYRVVWLVLIPLVLSFMIRVQSSTIPIADDYGRDNVFRFIREDLQRAYDVQYPNLPQQNKERLVNEEFQKAIQQPTYTIKTGDLRGQSFGIAQQVQQASDQFRSFFQYEANGASYMYMPDIDPYTYLRYARNYLEKGDVADERRDGFAVDNHMVAPLGNNIDRSIHPYVLAWIYKIMSVFNGKITLMQAASYFPLILIALSVIPVFFVARRFGGDTAAFFAALVFAVNGTLLARTNWGHADTDAYNIFFPLTITWFYLESLFAKRAWLKGVLLFIAGLATGLFAYAWVGWWYIFDFLLASSLGYLAFLIVAHRAEIKHGFSAFVRKREFIDPALVLVGFIAASAIFVSLFASFSTFMNAPFEPIGFASIKDAAKVTLFPNVLTTVAELNSASLGQAVQQMGVAFGKLPFFLIAVIGLILLVLPRERTLRDLWLFLAGLAWYIILLGQIDRFRPLMMLILFAIPVFALIAREALRRGHSQDIKLALFLTIWFLATLYSSTKGIRFVMLLVPAFSIAFGTGIGRLSQTLSSWAGRVINVSPRIIAGVVIAVFALLLFTPVQNAFAAARQDLPIVNDGWYNTLTAIKDASQPTAIITSWWDFGHHFKYFSDRRVTFDGASQNKPMAHWVGKILLTDDEELAIGLLRMLDCGSSTAFDALDADVQDASVTAGYVYDTVKLDAVGARRYLEERNISEATVDSYLKLTHCEPPEAFFIASGDMIGKSGVWGHFGSWDFNRADIWVFARNMPRDEGIAFILENNNVSREEAARLYDEVTSITDEGEGNAWIAPWPSYNGDLFGCSRKENVLECANGITVDLNTMDATMNFNGGRTNPKVFVYATEEGYAKKDYESSAPFGLTLVPVDGGFSVLLANEAQSASLFTKMYWFRGHGLSYLKPFTVQRDASGQLIYTYRVDWSGNETIINQDMIPKLVPVEISLNETIPANETA
ncbi:hypothetical protein HY493_03280 [Candidatus Woesearchaeota archaeon]|nr:hypothetical protein [Candidatus Woesearchaeota archaeon]